LQIRHDGQISSVLQKRVKPCDEKYSALQKWQNRCITRVVPCPRRDVSRSSRYVGCGMRWTLQRQVMSSPDENVCSGRRSRVVLAPRPWRQTGGIYPAGDGGNKRRSPGRARISRNTIARGKPGCPGCTCGLTRVLFSTFAHGTAGAVGARLSLRPLISEGAKNSQNPGKVAPRECLSTSGLWLSPRCYNSVTAQN
jgi:hypothetical protein